ncbi:MAG: hypothetical protein OER88_13395, partial [Planctomycetota bacterium]|nr:hypothetical protein [Planctomycetota bacterium]
GGGENSQTQQDAHGGSVARARRRGTGYDWAIADRKTRKQQQVLRQRLQKLQLQLSGAKRVDDEPGEIAKIEQEIADTKAKLEKLG